MSPLLALSLAFVVLSVPSAPSAPSAPQERPAPNAFAPVETHHLSNGMKTPDFWERELLNTMTGAEPTSA